jgi:hypothetical protein
VFSYVVRTQMQTSQAEVEFVVAFPRSSTEIYGHVVSKYRAQNFWKLFHCNLNVREVELHSLTPELGKDQYEAGVCSGNVFLYLDSQLGICFHFAGSFLISEYLIIWFLRHFYSINLLIIYLAMYILSSLVNFNLFNLHVQFWIWNFSSCS